MVKTRYLVPLGGGLTAEVDVYEGELDGLLTAEVEFADEAAAHAFDRPRGSAATSPTTRATPTAARRRRHPELALTAPARSGG